MTRQDLQWRHRGACNRMSPELFYISSDTNPQHARNQNQSAREVCGSCDVRDECFDWGIKHEKYGVWGGTSESERRNIRRQLGIVRRNVSDGTVQTLVELGKLVAARQKVVA
jgi:WhiB family redox-sensing transcriptional regulator